jgi:hypothetical protein
MDLAVEGESKKMTQGTTQLIAGVLGLVVFGGHVFFSIRAKPLGAKPYRFATYTAIGTGFLSLWFTLALVTEIRSGGRFGAVIVDMALVWGSFACSYGLFLRRRFGVVAFHGMCGLMLLSPLISNDVDAAELDRKMGSSAEFVGNFVQHGR